MVLFIFVKIIIIFISLTPKRIAEAQSSSLKEQRQGTAFQEAPENDRDRLAKGRQSDYPSYHLRFRKGVNVISEIQQRNRQLSSN